MKTETTLETIQKEKNNVENFVRLENKILLARQKVIEERELNEKVKIAEKSNADKQIMIDEKEKELLSIKNDLNVCIAITKELIHQQDLCKDEITKIENESHEEVVALIRNTKSDITGLHLLEDSHIVEKIFNAEVLLQDILEEKNGYKLLYAKEKKFQKMYKTSKGNGLILTVSESEKGRDSEFIGINKEKIDAMHNKFGSKFCISNYSKKFGSVFTLPASFIDRLIEDGAITEGNGNMNIDIILDDCTFFVRPRPTKLGKYDINIFHNLEPDDCIEKYIDKKYTNKK